MAEPGLESGFWILKFTSARHQFLKDHMVAKFLKMKPGRAPQSKQQLQFMFWILTQNLSRFSPSCLSPTQPSSSRGVFYVGGGEGVDWGEAVLLGPQVSGEGLATLFDHRESLVICWALRSLSPCLFVCFYSLYRK